ncbi:MAG TPA: hypothetical protein VIK33_14750 [Anaerolineae bacterium]
MNKNGTPLARPLRAWFIVEVFFGLGAISAVGLNPANTRENFAWPIEPAVMAAVLGAFYIASALLFLLPLFARRWEMIRVMILPAALFSTVQLLATFLHWDKFSVGTLPFYVWFASYLLPPPIFIGAYVWHQRRAGSAPTGQPLPQRLRQLLLILGGVLSIGAMLTFVFPEWLIASFAWNLTPLTTRSLCGWLIAVGTLMASMAREDDRARVRLATPTLILILPLLVIQMARFADQVNWGNLSLWLGLAIFAVASLCGLVLARGNWQETLS